MLRVCGLFSGIGGMELGLERAGLSISATCEREDFPREVLQHYWPKAPCYDDVRTLTAEKLVRDGVVVDVMCGGFPCQDLSTSGPGDGLDGERSGLWREYLRLIGELRPKVVILENSPELLDGWFGDVLGPLAELGYDAEWEVLPASALGAPHDRKRVWVVAYAPGLRQPQSRGCFDAVDPAPNAYREADNALELFQRGLVPIVCGRHDGVSSRLSKAGLSAYGNAVVPQIPEMIGRWIVEQVK